MSKIYQGVVSYYNEVKGYGFITDDDGGNHFIHVSEVVDKGDDVLVVGNRVEFAIGPSNNGKMQAVDCRVID
jgi:CspA family cold shock protein